MKIYFTSDTHFGHANILRFSKRPFHSVPEMNEALCENWASVVTDRDHIYHLGDVVFGKNFKEVAAYIDMVRKLPGRKFLVPGNHDRKYLSLLGWAFKEILPPLCELNVQPKDKIRHTVILSHFPMTSWSKSHHGALQLYGHLHGAFLGNQQQTDVGVDAWNYKPVDIDQILERLATLPPRFPLESQFSDLEEVSDVNLS